MKYPAFVCMVVMVHCALGATPAIADAAKTSTSRTPDLISAADMADDIQQLVNTLEAVHPNIYFRLGRAEAAMHTRDLLAHCDTPLERHHFNALVARWVERFGDDHTVAYPVSRSNAAPPEPAPAPSWRFAMIAPNCGYIDFRLMNDRPRWQHFMQETMQELQANAVPVLIIDLRNNVGGDSRLGDDLLSYLTDQPYRPAARKCWRFSPVYLPQIRPADPWGLSAGDPAGDPPPEYRRLLAQNPTPEFKAWLRANAPERAREILTRHAPHWLGLADSPAPPTETLCFELPLQQPETPPIRRYQGGVCFLIGPRTFSSAVILANIVEDFHLAPLIGEETKMCNQFGEPFRYTLPHSGLKVDIATAQYVRASGDAADRHGVRPTIPVPSEVIGSTDPALEAALRWANTARAPETRNGGGQAPPADRDP